MGWDFSCTWQLFSRTYPQGFLIMKCLAVILSIRCSIWRSVLELRWESARGLSKVQRSRGATFRCAGDQTASSSAGEPSPARCPLVTGESQRGVDGFSHPHRSGQTVRRSVLFSHPCLGGRARALWVAARFGSRGSLVMDWWFLRTGFYWLLVSAGRWCRMLGHPAGSVWELGGFTVTARVSCLPADSRA